MDEGAQKARSTPEVVGLPRDRQRRGEHPSSTPFLAMGQDERRMDEATGDGYHRRNWTWNKKKRQAVHGVSR